MGYFAVPYEIHFDDTMAYGSHHFLTNFKFQCAGREHLLFSPHFFEEPGFRRDFDRVLLLTYEGYSRNLAPANLGDRLVVLTSFEERGEVSVRFCFRTLKRDGTPVACGYQTVLCADRETGALCAFPPSFLPCFESLAGMFEPGEGASFRDRVLRGGSGVTELFPESVKRLSRELLAEPAALGLGRRVDDRSAGVEPLPVASKLELPKGASAFLFAGQGSFDAALFVRLKALQPELGPELAEVATRVAARGFDVAPLLEARDVEAVRAAMARSPSLDQLGIFLMGVMGARWLTRQGAPPDVYVGHSFGEIAALTAAGAFDLRAGAEVVCLRVRALQSVSEDLGTLAAVALGAEETVRALADSGAQDLEVAGRNHPRQTVVSGPRGQLERLRAHLEGQGKGFTYVASRYPFHHRGLAGAAEAFRAALARVETRAPAGRVYSPIEGRLYTGAPGELAVSLASHLVRPFDFLGAVERLAGAGCARFVDCGTDGRLARIVQRILPEASTHETVAIVGLLPAPSVSPALVPEEKAGAVAEDDSVAVVSLGCLLPGGASDPEAYWRNVRHGVSGIVDPGTVDPMLVADFVGPRGTPDRTYTLLTGAVRDEDLVAPEGMSKERFAGYAREQKLLAIALSQAVHGLGGVIRQSTGRIQCLLGSTAEGSAEYDAALSVEAGEALLRSRGMGGPEVEALMRSARAVLGVAAPSSSLAPHPTLQRVVSDVVGAPVPVVLLDAACASSLYAIALGMKALESGEARLVLAGGVFSPGPGNSCLFSQFNGLSATGSRPFDERADGVIFGEGAGVVGLMRVADARSAGLRIHAVIRGAGLSSDGRSSSANVPRSEGQVAAMEACYAAARVEPSSIQYLEAHGTATPAGDATELKSIARVFGGQRKGLQLASVKALIGHVGWAAGVASVIKLCKALEHRCFPKQSNFARAGEGLRALGPDFEVALEERPWPENGAHPRRAATNGFGFGGTNAHLVLEEYREGREATRARPPVSRDLVVVAAEGLFPDARGVPVAGVPETVGARFDFSAFRLPSSVRLLPDIAEDMDPTQGLALSVTSALTRKVEGFDALRTSTAIVLGLEGKTRRGVEAVQRVLSASTLRRLRALSRDGVTGAPLAPLAKRFHDEVLATVRPSGPYTLQGMMPNVTPGRVAGALDVKGPNFVVDAGGGSLAAALRASRGVLDSGFELALVGGVHVLRPGADSEGAGPREGLAMLAVTTPEHAARRGLKPVCRLRMAPTDELGAGPAHGVEECLAVLRAVESASKGRATTLRLHADAATRARLALQLLPMEDASARDSNGEGFDHSAPIGYHAPVLVERVARTPGRKASKERRVLFIAPDEALARALADQAPRLCGPEFLVVHAGTPGGTGRVRGIDLSREERAEEGLAALGFEPQLILSVCQLDPGALEADVVAATALRHEALELLFLVARRSYERLVAGEVELASLCVGGVGPRRVLHPVTGLFAGMLKSIAREVPARGLRAIATSAEPLQEALARVLGELGAAEDDSTSVEVCFDGSTRCVRLLRPTDVPAQGSAGLDARSVVLLTGGGRGVTAVHAAALLKRFGCTVVLLGRSDPADAPERVLRASEEELPTVEREFYAAELAAGRGAKLPELRARFERHLAVRELRATLDGLARLPGRTVYRVADVTRPEEVSRVVDEVVREHGRLDLVVHGAGTQTSKKLHRRRLSELRTNLGTKLLGLRNLREACASRLGKPVPFHVLTSAFSFIGNDGQADYGAANEALDRLCAWVSDAHGAVDWCSVGWLAWDGIGMTRGSEYRVLGASRQLRGIRAEEGEALFLQLVEGQPREPINVQLTPSERAFYSLELLPRATPKPLPPGPVTHDIVVDAGRVPCLPDHLVRGTPTLPGTWALDLMLHTALGNARADLRTVTIEDVRFSRFVRVKPGGRQALRVEATPLIDAADRYDVKVRLVGDIVHPSGRVLDRDVVHAEARFSLTREPPRSEERLRTTLPSGRGLPVHDPHCAAGAPIELRGLFDCLEDITLEPAARFARLDLPEVPEQVGQAVPALVLDAALRLSAMHVEGVSDAVFAPIQFQRAIFDRALVTRGTEAAPTLSLRSLPPRLEGEVLQCGTVAAIDEAGRLRMLLEGGLARPMA
ncbi:SDR family NAD(P)-dependent oxidoreductase [Myxococcus sp. K15C18031901]|uniref:type I polyketide synthase n=1 Tax=Myxococcus dinghuensis TaxID=2906761 RepID=UPI0020A703F5|nr:type I polyketide synthase [Myxococcus dinghuensis]MCP3098834.1 SDR family NAD(P)-dependent oxidoreductase [Myxococcus dinghuensis]